MEAAVNSIRTFSNPQNQIFLEMEPELASCMVKECIYRGFCPEMFGCGFDQTEAFQKELETYRSH